MSLPPVRFNDNEAFGSFTPSVHSLVGMLQSLEGQNGYELKCGCHVDLLLGKLPPSLQDNLFQHCMNKDILTTNADEAYIFIDLAKWLQTKARAKRFASQAVATYKSDFSKPDRKDKPPQAAKKNSPTAVFTTETKQYQSKRQSQVAVSAHPGKSDFIQKYQFCPHCNNNEHYLHGCPKFTAMNTNQVIEWIK